VSDSPFGESPREAASAGVFCGLHVVAGVGDHNASRARAAGES
jgi:hypothetical protein